MHGDPLYHTTRVDRLGALGPGRHFSCTQKKRKKRTIRILTCVGPSSKPIPIMPSGASQISSGIRHSRSVAAQMEALLRFAFVAPG